MHHFLNLLHQSTWSTTLSSWCQSCTWSVGSSHNFLNLLHQSTWSTTLSSWRQSCTWSVGSSHNFLNQTCWSSCFSHSFLTQTCSSSCHRSYSEENSREDGQIHICFKKKKNSISKVKKKN